MTKSEINKFKKILEIKQAELEKIVRNRDAIAIEKSADALDEVQHASERELAIRNLDRESNLLRNVRLALRRIDDGSFGTCLHCEEDISPKRVAAVPWAANCIQCQELADRNKEEGNEAFDDDIVSNAA
jgi:DnaK suppressor protein